METDAGAVELLSGLFWPPGMWSLPGQLGAVVQGSLLSARSPPLMKGETPHHTAGPEVHISTHATWRIKKKTHGRETSIDETPSSSVENALWESSPVVNSTHH